MKALRNLFVGLLSALIGYSVFQQLWVFFELKKAEPYPIDVKDSPTQPSRTTLTQVASEEAYRIEHRIEDGIERISYFPTEQRFKTPILLVHGMWFGAWCWELWQEELAHLGWESHAISLPGHGGSPVQRPIHRCTLDYYLKFLAAAVDRFEVKPFLIGHSMGGALGQWYLRYYQDDLSGLALVASWVAHSALRDGLIPMVRQDPLVVPLTMASWDASSWVRNPIVAAEKLISKNAVISPEVLHKQLGPESVLVVYQHNPPFWRPPTNVRTPIIVLAGEEDKVVTMQGSEETANHYRSQLIIAPGAGHTLMLEHNWQASLHAITRWMESLSSD